MAKRNKPVMRVDPDFDKFVKQILGKNLMKGNRIKTARVTKAMFNQYMKYPNVKKELEDADLD